MFFKYWVEFRLKKTRTKKILRSADLENFKIRGPDADQGNSFGVLWIPGYTHQQIIIHIKTSISSFLTQSSPVFSNKIIGNLTQENDFLLKLSFDDGCRPIVSIINN